MLLFLYISHRVSLLTESLLQCYNMLLWSVHGSIQLVCSDCGSSESYECLKCFLSSWLRSFYDHRCECDLLSWLSWRLHQMLSPHHISWWVGLLSSASQSAVEYIPPPPQHTTRKPSVPVLMSARFVLGKISTMSPTVSTGLISAPTNPAYHNIPALPGQATRLSQAR